MYFIKWLWWLPQLHDLNTCNVLLFQHNEVVDSIPNRLYIYNISILLYTYNVVIYRNPIDYIVYLLNYQTF